MSAPTIGSQHTNLRNLALLAGVFERLERGAGPVDAAQYRTLVERLKAALAADLPAEGLQAVLAASPAVAELYENLHYGHAGLCRAPLEAAVSAERAAREALQRAMSARLS